jgi:hypothetical protein
VVNDLGVSPCRLIGFPDSLCWLWGPAVVAGEAGFGLSRPQCGEYLCHPSLYIRSEGSASRQIIFVTFAPWVGVHFICAASRRGGERACHFLVDALHGAGADADLAGNFEDAFPGAQLSLDALFNGGADPRPTKRLARLYGTARFADGVAV